MDNNLSKPVKILISEQIPLPVIFYFGQVFVFYMSINKSVLEWFLLIISKQYPLTRFTNLLSRNHSMLFLIKKKLADPQYLITNFMIISTETAVGRCSSNWVFLKFAILARKHLCWNLFLINTPQVFSFEYCKVFMSSYFEKHLQTAAFQI